MHPFICEIERNYEVEGMTFHKCEQTHHRQYFSYRNERSRFIEVLGDNLKAAIQTEASRKNYLQVYSVVAHNNSVLFIRNGELVL